MSGTKRVPVTRSPIPQITPRSIELFNAMRQCRCTWRKDRRLGTMCPGCERWWKLHGDLFDELRVPVWQWPCVENPLEVDEGNRPEAVALWRAGRREP